MLFRSAAALVDGAGGVKQYTDARVRSKPVTALRERVEVVVDESLRKEEAHVAVVLRDGSTHARHVRHATGSRERPMTDEQLEAKFRELAPAVLDAAQVEKLVGLLWTLDELRDAGALARASVPAQR